MDLTGFCDTPPKPISVGGKSSLVFTNFPRWLHHSFLKRKMDSIIRLYRIGFEIEIIFTIRGDTIQYEEVQGQATLIRCWSPYLPVSGFEAIKSYKRSYKC